MAERLSDKPVINPSDRDKYMFFLDKEGYLARAEYARGKKLTDAEIRRRASETDKKRAERERIREERAEENEAERKEKIRRAEERIRKLKSQ